MAHLRERAERYYNDGVRQAEEGKHLAATASFRLALTFDDKNAEYKEAYERAFAISRDHTADGFFKRGIFEESVGRYETAGKLFVRAAEVYPKAAFLSKAAQAMIWAEDLPKARDYATKAVQADSESADARVMLARVYLQSGMKKNARREVDMALKIEPSNLEAKDLKKRMRRAW
ncbi:MAG: tetratricopeptide repeat protein [Myxococcales bacterium]|nr:tetratricopeptide repeat protein [Myxococcales bacterium]